ncbi:Outer membrane lipoprotein carrier protein LolA [uncultured Paludibacter sp.]|nr:Outer membrane lipoprotein carrier protein LolA [uncultured Paludibacter sp.]
MKKVTFIASLLMAFTMFTANAQSDAKAVGIIEKILNLSKTNAVKTNFTLTVKSVSAENQTVKGDITMKGNKFVLNTNDMNVFFDGKTQWAYREDLNEVSITNPTEKELAETNPIAILAAYKAKSVMKIAKKTASMYVIQLTPKDAKSDVKKILVNVNKTNNYPLSLQLTDKKGTVSTLTLTQFKSNLKVADSEFVFNKNKYKDVEVNDLR